MFPDMNMYLEAVAMVDRLRSSFLEVVKLELDVLGIHDINNIQAVMLFNLGEAEMTVGELTTRGCYLGSNVSYNVKKMVEHGYVVQERSVHDRRSMHVKLTDKGQDLRKKLVDMHDRHFEMLRESNISCDDLSAVSKTMQRLDRLWMRARENGSRTFH